MSRRKWLLTALAGLTATIVAVGAAVALTDDESAGPDAPTDGPPAMAGPDAEAMEAFRGCLEEQGVQPPEPGLAPGPGGVAPGRPQGGLPGGPPEELQRAFEACADELPEGAAPPGGGSGPAAVPLPSPG